ncbi:MAG: thiamine phosphate synthase [Prevotellaceae bacterium]|jgi:thiamine-phosphate pyrophosphorylase|nr:thiamine phosphate synthase [Prevotellaceae bacterium]
MQLIVVTSETLFEGEASALNMLFERGMSALHIRKPQASDAELRDLLLRINAEFHDRIVLHDGFSLVGSFRLRGVHLNRRNPVRPPQAVASVSRSCHSLNEVEQSRGFSYVFLSPVFNSISKRGYAQAFTEKDLLAAKAKGVTGEKVVALGGVSVATIPLAAAYGFGGVAVLGALWGDYPQRKDNRTLIRKFDELSYTVLVINKRAYSENSVNIEL